MLNVLPVEYKTTLHQSLLFHRVRRFSIFVITTMTLLGAMLLSTEWLLQRWQTTLPINTTIAQITPEERDHLELLITNLQKTNSAVQKMDQQFRNPLADVVLLLNDTPNTIQIHDLMVDYSTTEIQLTGTAVDRESLVSYQKILGQAPFLTKVTFPLSNLDIKEQIPFSMSAHLIYDQISS